MTAINARNRADRGASAPPDQVLATGSSGAADQQTFPDELQQGDVVFIGAEPALVLDEPLTVHRGLGMFDEFKILIGTHVQLAAATGPVFVVWEPTVLIDVRRTHAPCIRSHLGANANETN